MAYPTYKNLKSYQQSVIICDITGEFCKKYLNPKSRTVDQMEQAARSGKQNIVEGCSASRNSPKNEIFLLGVARASFEELLEDYQDFLRQRGLAIWGKDDPRSLEIRNLYKTNMSDKTHKSDPTHLTDKTYPTYMTYKSYLGNPEKIANAITTLINQTNYLLDMQIQGVKKKNEESGITLEPHNYKLARIQARGREQNQKFDEWMKEVLQK